MQIVVNDKNIKNLEKIIKNKLNFIIGNYFVISPRLYGNPLHEILTTRKMRELLYNAVGNRKYCIKFCVSMDTIDIYLYKWNKDITDISFVKIFGYIDYEGLHIDKDYKMLISSIRRFLEIKSNDKYLFYAYDKENWLEQYNKLESESVR